MTGLAPPAPIAIIGLGRMGLPTARMLIAAGLPLRGAEDADIDAAAPVFAALGREIHRAGALGSGHAMKALNNHVSGAGAEAAIEALQIGEAFGLDPARMVEVLNASAGRNNATEVKLTQFALPARFNSGFGIGLMAKDIRMAPDLAEAVGARSGLAAAVAETWERERDAQGPGADHTEVFRLACRSPPAPQVSPTR